MKRHPYILATVIASLTAIVVWIVLSKDYTAYTKLSDEYKETELAIGLNAIQAHIKEVINSDNSGINDMEIYSKVLESEDFARCIAHKTVLGKNITYGEYLDEEDTIEAIQDAIVYNYIHSQETLAISFTDKDPVIASQMLDSVTVELQRIITQHRRTIIAAALKNAEREVKETKEKYDQALNQYVGFADSHTKVKTPTMKLKEQALADELKNAYSFYQKASEQYVRQEALSQRYQMAFAVIQDNTVPQAANNHLIGYILSFIILALLLTNIITNYKEGQLKHVRLKRLGDIFSPWMLTISIWVLILGLYYALDTDLYPITKQFYYCFLLWVPIFCLCALSAYVLSADSDNSKMTMSGIPFNKSVFNFFFFISLIITPLYVYRVFQIVTMFGTEDLMTNIRTLAIYGEGQGILNYSAVINQALFVVALWAHPKVPTVQVVILGIACLMNSLAIMEKGLIFFVFVSTMFVLFEKRVIRKRTILTYSILIIIVFYIFNLGRAGSGSDYQEEETLFDFFTMYALSPPVAFSQLSPEVIPQFGTNTFETIYLFLKRFGADVVVKDKLQEFVFVPVSTNVYTIFQPFYIDFGYRGVALFAAIYGYVCGLLYRLFRSGNGAGTCLYTYGVYVMLLQFYQENVFLSMVFVLQLTFFILLFTTQDIKLQLSPSRL
ncbi:MAG: oligosaccharide repeat unit polymerase [Prevotella sp.]|nr:oligosaccharide repeat unit polymerase [Prevotella sp.]